MTDTFIDRGAGTTVQPRPSSDLGRICTYAGAQKHGRRCRKARKRASLEESGMARIVDYWTGVNAKVSFTTPDADA